MISIIIPAYNAERFIEETINSVLNQSYTDWELIIINDGSVDSTVEIIRPFLSEKVTLYSQKNTGVSAARNTGINRARGEYIAFLDADDYWLSENLSMKMNLFMDKSVDFVFSNFIKCDENLKKISNGPTGTHVNMLNNLLLWEQDVIPGASSNVIIKTKCFNNGLKFDSSFSTAADQDFCFYLTQSFTGKHLNEFTWCYRVYTTSMSKNVSVLTKDHIGVYKKAEKFNLFKSWGFKQKCFSNMYLILAGNWWVNASNKKKGFFYVLLALLYYPFNMVKIIKKIF